MLNNCSLQLLTKAKVRNEKVCQGLLKKQKGKVMVIHDCYWIVNPRSTAFNQDGSAGIEEADSLVREYFEVGN